MVFQDLALWPHLTVKGNLEFGLKAKGLAVKVRNQRIQEILQQIQMGKYVHVRPAELSGGQQQRVAFARALILHPEALLMDEPLSNLDVELNIQLRKEIINLHQQIGFTLVYVTHDREEAYEIADRIIVMEDGQIRHTGSAEDTQKYFEKLSKNRL
jgi:iron(III) transport system ATP-binding protein